MTAQQITSARSTASPGDAPATAAPSSNPAGSGAVRAATHLRLTRRGRAVLATLGALPIVAGAFVFGLNGGGAVASGQSSDVEFQYVTVRAGESLWSLAEELAPESDPRDVVDDLLSLNQLPSAGIEPGQRLAVPSRYEVVR
ncbi:LysM domain-containing protein [Rathayibacter oskolensis]|uniref:LysM domain-containing protein n=1 Tax=Rathayibacter oskolensis TaxID=1891671 RepID=A0A1X7PAC3_9MICO|nr:LysM peptidoglycan-binding domain-containing protein [Rathayibacter oskolensis]SMH47524.1 LysM domain-containing protein [Rathayibacter oskolensis]